MPEENYKIYPIPDMVLSPEERALNEQAGENKLPGVPKSAEESALLNTPQYSKVMEYLLRAEPKNRVERDNLVKLRRDLIRRWISNPNELEEYFDALHFVGEQMVSQKDKCEALEKEITGNLEKLLERQESPKAAGFAKLLRLAAKSPLYGELSKRIIRYFFEEADTPEKILDYMYEFALATAKEADRETFIYAVKSLCMGTDIMPLKRDKVANFVCLLSTRKDEVLRKEMEVDATISALGTKFAPEEQKNFQSLSDSVSLHPEVQAALQGADPKRLDAIHKYLDKVAGKGLVGFKEQEYSIWPASLTQMPGSLRTALNKRIEVEYPGTRRIRFPGGKEAIFSNITQDALNGKILTAIQGLPEETFYNQGEDVRFAFLLKPDLPPEKTGQLAELNQEMQRTIKTQWTHTISPRGDRIKIVDKGLMDLGFESILFEMGKEKDDTLVTVKVGRANARLRLDGDFCLCLDSGESMDTSFDNRAFLEQVILTHLHELLCTDRVLAGEHEVPVGQAEQKRRQFLSRRGHKRKLPAGQAYSLEAAICGLEETRGRIDLVKINLEAGLTKETGQYTYVRISDVPLLGSKPLISRAPHAMDRFHQVIESD